MVNLLCSLPLGVRADLGLLDTAKEHVLCGRTQAKYLSSQCQAGSVIIPLKDRGESLAQVLRTYGELGSEPTFFLPCTSRRIA